MRNFPHWIRVPAVCLLLISLSRAASAQQQAAHKPDAAGEDKMPGNFNITMKTAGGLQYWGDELVCSGWRIQRNCFTGHCRLLDGNNRRRAWGTLEECRAAFDIARRKEAIAPTRGHVVIVLHGLAGMRPMMESMCRYLREQGKFTVVDVAYPSTRVDVDADAEALGRIVGGMPEAEQIDFVAHSLGNIVVRRYLSLNTDAKSGKKPDARIKRIVMLAPPNHGVPYADKLASLDVTGQVVGPAARELTIGWNALEPKLATPACEFGVLAGGHGNEKGFNPLIAGDNDGVVTVASTKLKGARDYRLVPELHFQFMNQVPVQKFTLQFLKEGCFETDARRTPL